MLPTLPSEFNGPLVPMLLLELLLRAALAAASICFCVCRCMERAYDEISIAEGISLYSGGGEASCVLICDDEEGIVVCLDDGF